MGQEIGHEYRYDVRDIRPRDSQDPRKSEAGLHQTSQLRTKTRDLEATHCISHDFLRLHMF